jgi:hypothetical protein
VPNEEKLIAWKITPDPQGAFESLIVGSLGTACEEIQTALQGAMDLTGQTEGEDDLPGGFTIEPVLMTKVELEALPEP